jgi:hypothetical protein
MAAKSLTSLFEEYRDTAAEVAARSATVKPYADRLKQLATEIQDALVTKGKRSHKAAGLVATLKDKPNSVSWMNEFLRRHGPAEVEQLKADAGTKTVLDITEA